MQRSDGIGFDCSVVVVVIIIIIIIIIIIMDFCGVVIRVPGYRSRGPGSIPGVTRFSGK
jgi:hypothetical protein